MNNGAYDLEGVIWHQHSNKLMKKLLELWSDKKRPIVDLGCGHNFYASVFVHAGYFASGVDMVDLGSKYFDEGDLTEPQDFSDANFKINILSLEVGEHIPPDKSDAYLDNVVGSANGGEIILSWALPGQPGHGHINCRSGEWVIEEMNKRGYDMVITKTNELRMAVDGCHCTWFRNTLMYFTPNGNKI